MKIFRFTFVLFLLTWLSIMNLNAGIIPRHSVIQTNYGGSPVVIGTTNANCSTTATSAIGTQWDKKVVNRIGFEVNYNYQGYFSSIQDVKIKLSVTRKDAASNPIGDTIVYLRVKYIPNIDSNQWAKNYCQFKDAYQVDINIDSIYVNGSSVTTLPANLRITNDILIDRYNSYDDYSNTVYGLENSILTNDCDETPRTIRINWNTNPQITEYQLEWMHVNDYGFDPLNPNAINPNPISPEALAYNFRKNSTRISTTNNYFDLNLVFNRGWIVYRIRGVGYFDGNNENEIYGAWSIVDEGFVNDVSAVQRFQITDAIAHENTLNWQYAATYAEDGKHKEVVSYFDGSLRNRQSVTKINSDNNTIVGETIYDHQGRAAVQVLPVPVPACEISEQSIHFYPNFNKNENSPEIGYNRLNFDIERNGCAVNADPMSTESGASNYYSDANENKADAQGYVPDAHKYPFTQVEFTPDNTGRIRRQSGVGTDFKLGSTHETEYLYGQPEQVVLDRLFGNEVGYASHYKENAVIDANGQVSISYLDQEGRVIATALAAEAPPSTKELSSAEGAEVLLTVNAFGDDNNQNQQIEDGYHFYKEILVKNPSTYKFMYDFKISPLKDECLPDFCINCVYDLDLTLKDECGVNYFPEDVNGKLKGQFTFIEETSSYIFHALCEEPTSFQYDKEISISLPIGSYSLSKTLTINNDARQAYIDLYLSNAEENCIKSLEEFQNEELENIDISGCNVTCEECKENLGSLEAFITKGEGSANDYYAQAQECDKLCNSETISLCEITRRIMEMDMAPGGQYGEYLNTLTNEIDFTTFPISIYNPNHQLPTTEQEPWRHPSHSEGDYSYTVYKDENGDTSKIWLHQLDNGTWIPEPLTSADIIWDPIEHANFVLPNRLLQLNDFILNYNHSWGKSLVQYHPEYCYLESCYAFEDQQDDFALSSEDFDSRLMHTNTFSEAKNKGFITDDNVLEDWFNPTNNDFSNTDHQWDPFVHLGDEIGDCFNSSSDLENNFNSYKTINGSTYTMSQFAAYLARCSSNPNSSPIEGCYNFGGTFNGTYNTSILDQEWRLLRSLYLAEKDKIRADIMECYALDCSNGMYCGCIGNEDYSLSAVVSSQLSSDPYNPCGSEMHGFYQDKDKRFINENDITSISSSESVNDAVYQYYLATGQCPVPTAVQSIFNKLAIEAKLTSTSTSTLLNDYPEFNSLLVAINNMQLPAIVPSVYHTAVELDPNTLELTWTNNLDATTFAKITLTKNGALNWADITNFTGINAVPGSVSQFTMNGKKVNPSDYVVLDQVAITGELEVITFEDCRNFGQDCEPNLLGNDISEILSHVTLKYSLDSEGFDTSLKSLTEDQNIISATSKKKRFDRLNDSIVDQPEQDSTSIENTDVFNLQTLRIEKLIGSTNELYIKTNDNINFNIYDPNNSSENGIKIKFTDITVLDNSEKPYILSKIIPLSRSTFKILGFSGKLKPNIEIYGTITVIDQGNEESEVPIGDCYLPLPNECKTPEHDAFRSLENIMKDIVANHSDFLDNPFMSQSLLNQLPTGISSIDTQYDSEKDIATFSYKECEISFTVPGDLSLIQAREILRMEVNGNPDVYGNYHEVKLYTKFELDNGTITYDYILGTTCFKLKQCDVCIEEKESTSAISDKRSNRIDAGLFIEDPYFFEDLADSSFIIPSYVFEKYNKYESFLDSMNTVLSENNSDPIKKMSLTEFAGNGYYLQVDNYIRYGQRHKQIENIGWLYNFKKFVIYSGIGTNVTREYWSYYNGVNNYNLNRDSSTQDELSLISIDNFIAAKLAEKGDTYTAYLQNLDSTTTLPIDILTYFSADTIDTSEAGLLYNDYTSAYLSFFKHQDTLDAEQRCFESDKLYPLFSYEDFIEQNCYCPDSSSAVFVDYISQLSDTTSCPGDFPEYSDCSTERSFATKQSTQRLYLEWLEKVENYNNSYHAIFNENYLELQENSFKWFIKSFDNSSYIKEYLHYLTPFFNDEKYKEGKAPISLEQFYKLAAISVDVDAIDCETVYDDYVQATNDFNVWAVNNEFPFNINGPVDFDEFINKGSCYCIDKYIQNLNYITENFEYFTNEENFYLYIGLSHLCENNCEDQYKKYQSAVNEFNTWATENEFAYTIETLISPQDFVKSGACLCIEKLIEKLKYISQNPTEFTDITYFNQYLELSKLCEPTCQDAFIKYQEITTKFNDWAEEKQFPNTIQMITAYEDFVNAGACLCIEAYAEKLQYIVKNSEQFFDESTFNDYIDLSKICDIPCLDAYKKYVEITKKYNEWATSKEYPFLINEIVNYEDFIKSGACQCIDLYYDKLKKIFINPENFKDKENFYTYVDLANLCDKSCNEAYEKYLEATKKFNSWAVQNNYPFYVKEIATYEGFMESGACLCIENYFEKLLDIAKNGKEFDTEDEFYHFIELSQLCDKPCTPDVLDPNDITPVVSTEVVFVDTCLQMAINQANFNAQQRYDDYINNLKTDLYQRYTEHCMGVKENFTYQFTDKTYHFTLYYYDQAGNLIKTIPPAGVSPLAITAWDDALSLQIKSDRQNNTKSVFTNHRMATAYEYNSLNQLVSQKTPDTDAMNEFALTLPNGLPYQLVTNRIQMLDEKNGYLAGELNNRGYLFRTTNGGVNWSKVNGLIASDYNKIEMLDAQVGFAVGSKGTVMKTTDGGNTWDWISLMDLTWDGPLPDLYDIDIRNGSSPTITIIGAENFIVQSNDLTTFELWNQGLSNDFSFNMKAIDHDDAGYKIAAVNEDFSIVFERGFTATEWTANLNMKGLGLSHIIEYGDFDETDGQALRMAFGTDGRTYIVSKTEPLSLLYSTNLVSSIDAVKFFSEQQGIAIQQHHLLRTTDKARTWTEIDNVHNYNGMSVANNKSSILAVGDNKSITLFVPSDSYNSERVDIPFASSTNVNFDKSWHYNNENTNQTSAVVSAGNKFYYSWNIASPAPQWHSFDGGYYANVKSMELRMDGNTIKGFALTNSGDLVELNITGSTGSATPFSSSVSVKLIKKEVSNEKIAILYTDGTLKSYDPATASETTIYSGLTADYSDMVVEGTDFTLAGTTHIDKITLNENSDYELTPYLIFAEKLNDILYEADNDRWMAVGDDGSIFNYDESNGNWNLQKIQSNYHINQIIWNGTDFYAAGSHGLLGKVKVVSGVYSYDFLKLLNMTPMPYAVENDLYDLAINDTKMYAVGTEGIVLYSPNYATVRFGKDFKSDFDLNAVATVPGNTNVISVGKNNVILDHTATSILKREEQFPTALSDVHFSNGVYGTIVGHQAFVRSTQNGAMNWDIALPATTPSPTLSSVATLPDGTAIGASNHGLQYYANGTFATVSGTETMSHISETAAFGSFAYFVEQDGTTANVYKFDASNQSYSTLSSFSGAVNALKILDNGSYALTGNDGLFAYVNEAGTTYLENPTELGNKDFYDMAVLDALTFVLVGKDGAYYHSKEATDDGNGYLQSCAWFQQTGVFDGNTDPYLVDASSEIDIHTISFGTSTLGVMGGKYKSSFADFGNEQHCYVRTVYDAPERYSARFYYDKLGRLVVSQNARQYNADQVGENAYKKYSYSLYDALGRVIEAGEKTDNPLPPTGSLNRFRDVFGSYVSDIYNPSVIDDAKLQAWIEGAGERREVTRSYYDQTVIAALPSGFSPNPTTQRKRITHVTYEETFDGNDQTYDHATHYDYDIHGNVKTMLQDNKKMAEQFSSLASQQFKRLDYRYDLVSGNVHRMSVQNGEVDQWHHAYRYDADNRIVEAYTNKNTPLIGLEQASYNLENELNENDDWENDAKYYYYAHGPLARTEIGDKQLQGYDFIYNLQGWMKGVNAIENTNDPGKDGIEPSSGTNPNLTFAKDLTAFSLEYFNNDYTAINSATPIASVDISSVPATYSKELFNGNIRYMQTRLTNPTTGDAMPMLNAYEYDQLNRLKASRSFETGLSGNVWNPLTYSNEYYNAFDFDAMGNILYQQRHKRNGDVIEKMTYQYQYEDPTNHERLMRNRLYHINDEIASTVDATDIDDQGTFTNDVEFINQNNSYSYDEEGRLVKDNAEGISKIVWRVDGKVKEIQRVTGEGKWLKFDYDAMGHRIAKHVYNNTGTAHERSTYYVLDAQGNQISTYDHEVVSETAQFNLKERNIFGSSRIGSKQDSLNVLTAILNQNITQILGTKYYEFSNHLGNVLTVYSDVKIPLDADADYVVEGFRVPIRNTADYSPFGVQLDGRTIQREYYRYGFNKMEADNEIKGQGNSYDFGARMYDSRVGRFLSLDNYSSKFPHQSPYSFANNTPIIGTDINGDSLYILTYVQGYSHGDDMFKASAYTRKYDIENNKSFDKTKDKVVMIEVTDLAKVKTDVEKVIISYSNKYGETAEFGIWSHSGLDGPIGSENTSSDAIKDSPNQMSLDGWNKIDFNWAGDGSKCRAGFYGCNSGNEYKGPNKAFSTQVSGKSNMKNVSVLGQTTSSYPSKYTNWRSLSLIQSLDIYLPVKYEASSPILGGRISYNKTYMVGCDKYKGFYANTTGTKANPMNISKNGKIKDKKTWQTGDKH